MTRRAQTIVCANCDTRFLTWAFPSPQAFPSSRVNLGAERMTSLYNCRSRRDGAFSITKFDEDLNPVSTYALVPTRDNPNAMICECPASSRKSCRHRDMLPMFLAAGRVDTGWVLDWDNDQSWRQYTGPLAEELPAESGYIPFSDPEAVGSAPASEGAGATASSRSAPAPTFSPTYRRPLR